MDFSKLESSLSNIFKQVDVELPTGRFYTESLVCLDYYNKKEWSLLPHIGDRLSYTYIDLFVQALNKLKIEQVETFIYTCDDIKYYKSVEPEYQKVKDIFYNIQSKDKDWDSEEVIASSLLITNKTIDFIVYIDDIRENFYFYGDKNFIKYIMPISCEAQKDCFEVNYEVYEYEPWHVDYLKWLYRNYLGDHLNC